MGVSNTFPNPKTWWGPLWVGSYRPQKWSGRTQDPGGNRRICCQINWRECWTNIYHFASTPCKTWMFNCATLQHASILCKCDTKSFTYTIVYSLPRMLNSVSHVYMSVICNIAAYAKIVCRQQTRMLYTTLRDLSPMRVITIRQRYRRTDGQLTTTIPR